MQTLPSVIIKTDNLKMPRVPINKQSVVKLHLKVHKHKVLIWG